MTETDGPHSLGETRWVRGVLPCRHTPTPYPPSHFLSPSKVLFLLFGKGVGIIYCLPKPYWTRVRSPLCRGTWGFGDFTPFGMNSSPNPLSPTLHLSGVCPSPTLLFPMGFLGRYPLGRGVGCRPERLRLSSELLFVTGVEGGEETCTNLCPPGGN